MYHQKHETTKWISKMTWLSNHCKTTYLIYLLHLYIDFVYVCVCMLPLPSKFSSHIQIIGENICASLMLCSISVSTWNTYLCVTVYIDKSIKLRCWKMRWMRWMRMRTTRIYQQPNETRLLDAGVSYRMDWLGCLTELTHQPVCWSMLYASLTIY